MGNIGFFNAEEVAPVGEFGVMPEGVYELIVNQSEVKVPSSGKGEMLSLEMEVLDGEFKGRKVWENFTLKNDNEKAVQIGRGKLSSLCRALGVMQLTDSQQLHFIPFQAKLKVRPAKGEYQARNEVASYVAKGAMGAVAATALAGASDGDIPEWLKAAGNAPEAA